MASGMTWGNRIKKGTFSLLISDLAKSSFWTVLIRFYWPIRLCASSLELLPGSATSYCKPLGAMQNLI